MAYFKHGPSQHTLSMLFLVRLLMQADRERVFPWEEYLESIMQSCKLKLLSQWNYFAVGWS